MLHFEHYRDVILWLALSNFWGLIYKISYHNLMIMPKVTIDLQWISKIYRTSYKGHKALAVTQTLYISFVCHLCMLHFEHYRDVILWLALSNFWGPIYQISYYNLTIMPKVTIDLRWMSKIYRTSYKSCKAFFLGAIHLQNRKIIWDSDRILAYDILQRNLSMSQVTIVSRSYDKLFLRHAVFDMFVCISFMCLHVHVDLIQPLAAKSSKCWLFVC